MTARILDGKEAARQVREELRGRVHELSAQGRTPRLVVVLVGDDPASRVYVRTKGKAAREIGIDAETLEI
ncbi:MAG: tetrahydrofolate dehydrogenase/cyclohydrolase catalytic domain-containing protein, partial [bacterium]